MPLGTHLSESEICQILKYYHEDGIPRTEIAKRLGRSRSVVNSLIRRGTQYNSKNHLRGRKCALTEEEVELVRGLAASGNYSIRQIQRQLPQVSFGTIYKVVKSKEYHNRSEEGLRDSGSDDKQSGRLSTKCLFCLSNLSKGRRGSQVKIEVDDNGDNDKHWEKNKDSRVGKFKVLLGYLLDTHTKRFEGIQQRILGNLLQSEEPETGEIPGHNSIEDGAGATVKLCTRCDAIGDKVLELHLELEKAQMKIIHKLKEVKGIVLNKGGFLRRYSKAVEGGSDSSDHVPLEGNTLLQAFQDAVHQKDQTCSELPLVYLKKYGILHKPFLMPTLDVTKDPSQTFVKTEPSFEEEFDQLFPSPNEFVQDDGDDNIDNNDNNLLAFEDRLEMSTKIETASDPDPTYQNKKSLRKSTKSSGRGTRETKIVKSARKPIKVNKKKMSSSRSRLQKVKSKSAPKGARPIRRKKYLPCEICEYKTNNVCRFEEHLRKHEVPEPSTQPFTCEKCNDSFSTQQYFKFHTQRHGGIHKLKCELCLSYFNGFTMIDHMKTHVEEIFPCPKCTHCLSSRESYHLHLRRNHEGGNLSCDICSKPFQTKYKLLSHLHEVHKVIDKLKCDFPECNKTFLDECALTFHKVCHTDQFSCNLCGKGFSASASLKIHLRSHSGEKPFKCNSGECTASFYNHIKLQEHSIREHGAPKFKCEDCGKEYGSKSGLAFHIGAVHEDGKLCPICNKRLGSTSKLKMHIENHSDIKKYVCEKCGKSFKTASLYSTHKALHRTEGEKKHRCSYCPAAFAIKKYLTQHTRIHTGEKPFACEFCQKAFNQQGARNTHQKKCSSNPNVNIVI